MAARKQNFGHDGRWWSPLVKVRGGERDAKENERGTRKWELDRWLRGLRPSVSYGPSGRRWVNASSALETNRNGVRAFRSRFRVPVDPAASASLHPCANVAAQIHPFHPRRRYNGYFSPRVRRPSVTLPHDSIQGFQPSDPRPPLNIVVSVYHGLHTNITYNLRRASNSYVYIIA